MTALPPTQATARPATTARLLHAAMTVGVVLFGLVTHFVIRPARPDLSSAMAPMVINILIGASLVATTLAFFVLRPRMPRRSTDESADLYWTTATVRALTMWAIAEAGGLVGGVAYLLAGSTGALIATVTAVVGLIALHPGRLERA